MGFIFQEIKNSDLKSTHICVDLIHDKSIIDGFKKLDKRISSLDILINVAGINYCKNHNEISYEEFNGGSSGKSFILFLSMQRINNENE